MNKKRYTTLNTDNIYNGDSNITTKYKWCIYDRLESKIVKQFKTKKETNTKRKELYNY